jgi:hypothetical protein
MFDKNMFKNEFRTWSDYHPFANLNEIEGFCDALIPDEFKSYYAWLVGEYT